MSVYIWDNYRQSLPEYQKQMLDKLKASIPEMTVPEQIDAFIAAPPEATLKCLPLLEWEAQVAIYMKHLPAKARPKAVKALKFQALVKLGIIEKPRKKKYVLA